MTDEERYYSGSDHDTENEYPLGACICVLACVGMFSYLCAYLLEYTK